VQPNLRQFCAACGGKCCRLHPNLTQQEYDLLRKHLGEAALQAAEPQEIQPGVWRLKGDCPALGPGSSGCRIPAAERPLVCLLYPFHAARTEDGWILLLDVKGCPFWMQWGEQYHWMEEALLRHLKETQGALHA
jgi:Fe-S-cluster containining protein